MMSESERTRNQFVSTTEEFIAGLKSEDVQERMDSAWALSELGAEAKEAIPALIEALNDPEGRVVCQVCEALQYMSPESRIAIPKLK